jgi:hypothetical protein
LRRVKLKFSLNVTVRYGTCGGKNDSYIYSTGTTQSVWRIQDFLSRIPDPTFSHHGSRIRTVSIPDPGSSKNLSILNPKKAKKWFLSSKKYDPGCSSRIRMLTFSHPGFRIQGSKRHPIPDPGSATLHSMIQLHVNSVWDLPSMPDFIEKYVKYKTFSSRYKLRHSPPFLFLSIR